VVACGDRTTAEGGNYRGQGCSRSLKEDSYHEGNVISVAATNVSPREDEHCTSKRPCPVRTLPFAGAHALVLFKLTACLCLSFRPKAPKQQPRKAPAAPVEVATKPKAVPTKRKKTRKGPARLTKKRVTVQDLDEEMDAYRAAVPQIGGDLSKMAVI